MLSFFHINNKLHIVTIYSFGNIILFFKASYLITQKIHLFEEKIVIFDCFLSKFLDSLKFLSNYIDGIIKIFIETLLDDCYRSR